MLYFIIEYFRSARTLFKNCQFLLFVTFRLYCSLQRWCPIRRGKSDYLYCRKAGDSPETVCPFFAWLWPNWTWTLVPAHSPSWRLNNVLFRLLTTNIDRFPSTDWKLSFVQQRQLLFFPQGLFCNIRNANDIRLEAIQWFYPFHQLVICPCSVVKY